MQRHAVDYSSPRAAHNSKIEYLVEAGCLDDYTIRLWLGDEWKHFAPVAHLAYRRVTWEKGAWTLDSKGGMR